MNPIQPTAQRSALPKTNFRLKRAILFLLLFGALSVDDMSAAPGDLDPSFATTGTVTTDFSGREDFINAVAVQPDGKIVAVGFTRVGRDASTEDFAITRYNPNGTLDTTFGTGGRVTTNFNQDDRARAVAIRSDGKIIVAGSNASVVIIAAYNSDGTRDTSIGSSFGPCSGQCSLNAVAIQSDQKIVVAGRAQGAPGTSDFFLIRFNAAGNGTDTGFNGTGFVSTDFFSRSDTIAGIVIQTDGKIVVGGTATTDASGSTSFALARYNTNGTLDGTFGTGGKVTTAFTGQFHGIRGIALQNDGKIIGAGFTFVGDSNFGLARYNTDGNLDTNFGTGGKITTDFSGSGLTDEAHAVVVQSDGRIIAGGIVQTASNALDFALVRYNSDGTVDSDFGAAGNVTTTFSAADDVVNAMVLQSDGRLVAAGLANEPPDFALARYFTAVAGPPAKSLNISTRMRVETGSNVLIAGFIITGNAAKDVAVRGIGPSLTQFGIADALADPTLELRNSSAPVAQNDNWQDDSASAGQLNALNLGLQNANESGLVASLAPAAYTATLAGKNQGTGVGLVEVYDVNQAADSQLANISTRGLVGAGNNVMIGGFILGGSNDNTRIAVRGIGPSLAAFGLSPVLADPTLELRNSNGALLVSNDNWQDDPASAGQLSANGLALQDSVESGIFTILPPGQFTAILAGKSGGTGIGLVEIYNLQ